jgi:Tfp pilus assembly protein PilF
VATSVGCRTVALPQEKHAEPIAQLVPAADGSPENADKELPPKEVARLCMATGEEYEKAGDELHAIFEYEKARKSDPTAKASRHLGVLYDRMGDFQKAQEEYRLALEQSPKDADLLNDIGYGYYSRGRWAESEKYLRQALAAKPKHARAAINLGLCLGAQGHFEEALEMFNKAVTPAQAHSNLAFVLTTQHKWAEARREYQQALQIDPDIPLARAALAKLEKAEREPRPLPTLQAAAPAPTPAIPAKPEVNGASGYVQMDEVPEEKAVQQAAHWTPVSPPQSPSVAANKDWQPVARP